MKEGVTTKFQCDAYQIHWTLNNNELPANVHKDNKELIIPEVEGLHEGYYICEGLDINKKKIYGYATMKVLSN